jgi:hypothetical protein
MISHDIGFTDFRTFFECHVFGVKKILMERCIMPSGNTQNRKMYEALSAHWRTEFWFTNISVFCFFFCLLSLG